MKRVLLSSLMLMLVLMSSCAASAPGSTRHSVLQLHEAAEAAHHCAGEEATDDARAAELQACIAANLKTARALLPGVIAAQSTPARNIAVLRLFLDEDLSTTQRADLCAQVPTEDFMEGLLDDEARAGCGR